MPKIIAADLDLTNSDVGQLIARVSQRIRQLKLEPQDRIAVHADISLKGLILVMAVIRLGLKVAFCPIREPALVLSSWLSDLGIDTILYSGGAGLEGSIKAEVYDISHCLDSAAFEESIPDRSHDFLSYIRTSGTSDTPKTAVISGQAHWASASSVNGYFKFGEGKTWALSLPLYHVSGLSIIFRALCSGAGIYLAPDHQQLLKGFNMGKLTHCSVVPSQVKRLLNDRVDLSGLEALVVGGDSLSLGDREAALARGWPLYESYGLCESASMIAVNQAGAAGTGTTILPHAEMRFGEDQEIFVRAASLFAGYWASGHVVRKLTPDGFFATGDVGSLDEFSQLQLICRKNNRIISGGENIQAEEIERLLEQHPVIDECVVMGMADEKMGARPVAFIRWIHEPLTDRELYDFLAPSLAAYKWPVQFRSYPHETPQGLKKPRQWLSRYLQNARSSSID